MAVTMETTGQWAGDGNNKALPLGIQKFSTDGKVSPVITGVADANAVVGQMYVDVTGKKLYVCSSVGPVAWLSTALS